MANPSATTTLKLQHFEPAAKAWISGAQTLADQRSHSMIEPLHALAQGLSEPGVGRALVGAGVDLAVLRERVEGALGSLSTGRHAAYLSDATLELLRRAEKVASEAGARRVRRQDLLVALTQEREGLLGDIWRQWKVSPAALDKYLAELGGARTEGALPSSGAASESALTDLVSEARAERLDPAIGRVDLVRRLVAVLERRTKNHPVLVGEHGVGKRSLVSALAQRIARGDVPTRLSGARLLAVDATRLVAGARLRSEVDERVRRILGADVEAPETVLVLYGLDALAGSGPQGAVLAELLGPGGPRLLGTTTPEGWVKLVAQQPTLVRAFSVLSVEEPNAEESLEMVRGGARRLELHHGVQIDESAVRAAGELSRRYLRERFLPESAFDLLDEAAARKRLAIDGIPEDVDRRSTRLDSLLAQVATLEGIEDEVSRGVRLRLDAEASALRPEVEEARRALGGRRRAVEELRQVQNEHLRALAELETARAAKDFRRVGELEHGVVPELEARRAQAEQKAQEAGLVEEPRVVSGDDVAQVLAAWTGVPVAKMMEGEAERLAALDTRLEERVLGQSHAVDALSRAVRRGRVGLRDPKKPIGSFLFLGPSGVGKTELAKALAEALFDDEAALTRLDMSEFMEKHMAQRLIGAPPGYADSEQGGFLTEAVRKRPYSVLLFDEVEKAHHDVFNLLLQVLDDGRLTDGRGRLADFSNTVVLLTSNIGSERILDVDEQCFENEEGLAQVRTLLNDSLRAFFRPELLNRLDDVVVFRPLGKPLLRRILDKEIRALRRALTERELTLDVSEEALDAIVSEGYEPALGARPLKRVIVRELLDPVAEALVKGGVVRGSVVRVALDAGRVSARVVPPA